MYIYIYIDVSFIYQPPRSFLSTHSSKASLNFSSVISTPFFQSSQLLVPRWSCIQIHPKIWQFKCHMRLAQKKWYSLNKKDVGQESLFFAICPHVWVLTHSHHRLETFARTFFPPSVLDVLFGQLDLAPRIFCLSDGHLHHDFLERSRDERINGVEGVPTLLSGMSFMWIHGKAWPNGTIP